MPFSSIAQCDRSLDFKPRLVWPRAFPACAWNGRLLTGFERVADSPVLDLSQPGPCTFVEAVQACYPSLGLSELARLIAVDATHAESLCAVYGLRWCERLQQTMSCLVRTPFEFQQWVDDKKLGARDLAPLLALPVLEDFASFLNALPELTLSKSQATLVLEYGVELFLLGHPLPDLLPSDPQGEVYLRRLESWRKPMSSSQDETWRKTVTTWPWPAQVQGNWQRFGDQVGLEIKIRTTSPQDFHKKLERLVSISDKWSCT